MVVDRRDAQRPHRRDRHRPVEGRQQRQLAGNAAEIVQRFQKRDRRLHKQAGYVVERLRQPVEIGLVAAAGFDGVLDDGVDLVGGELRPEDQLQAGVGRVERDFLFDGQHHLDAVARVNPLAADEAVDARPLRHGADVGGHQQMQHAEAL